MAWGAVGRLCVRALLREALSAAPMGRREEALSQGGNSQACALCPVKRGNRPSCQEGEGSGRGLPCDTNRCPHWHSRGSSPVPLTCPPASGPEPEHLARVLGVRAL